MANTKKVGELKIDIKDDIAEGKYANLVLIAHTPVEFIMDFATVLPLHDGAQVGSRIVMAPEHAKRFLLALQENIGQYEKQNGEIHIRRSPQSNTVAPFGIPKGEA